MNKPSNTLLSIAAMTAALTISSSATHAQYRVGNDGRALDANNRLGSGGFNKDPGVGRAPRVDGNQIVTGNVTGGKEFRGPVGYTDPGAFRGATGDTISDRFIRSSSAAPINGVSQNNANNTNAFYGSSRAVAPPPGYMQQGYSGAYVPAPAPVQTRNDQRLGAVISTPQTLLPPPGDLFLPGPVDPTAGATMISASPLYGVRQWRSDDAEQQQFVDRFSADQRSLDGDGQRIDPNLIKQYQDEIRDTDANGGDAKTQGDALPTGQLNAVQGSDAAAINNDAMSNAAISSSAMRGQLGTDQGTRLELQSPVKQSALYARLQEQFDAEGKATTDQEAARRFNLQRKAAAAGDADATKKDDPAKDDLTKRGDDKKDVATDDKTKLPLDANATETPAAADPVKVDSLAAGMNAKGLGKLMNDAEANMRAGKFGAAIDVYDTAARVAPNNPLVTLGRAHAELGASYYGRAESDIRKAFATGPALMAGQYDLVSFFGEDRLAFLIKDLKEIASNEPQQSGPTFLLAYIARNMGNNERAGDYLTETEKRLGGPDALVGTLRQTWRLAKPGEDANK